MADKVCAQTAEVVEIGHGVTIQFWFEWPQEEQTEPAGIIETHPGADGKPCEGSVAFEGHAPMRSHPTWRVVSLEPLTLEPSLLCTKCGHHGFIRDGRWVPA